VSPIVDVEIVGQHPGYGVPVASDEVRLGALVDLGCCVLRAPRRPTELIERRDRGVDVRLIEPLATIDHVAVDCQDVDPAPLGVKAL
jgi:hypothetical protein